jgi:hypothetical protein
MQALDDVGPVPGLVQAELGAPGDDLDLVVDVGCRASRRLRVRGTPSTRATMLTAKFWSAAAWLVEVVEDDEAGASRLSSNTSGSRPWPTRRGSAMPSISRRSPARRSWPSMASTEVWYGISVTTMRVAAALALLDLGAGPQRIEPRPVR